MHRVLLAIFLAASLAAVAKADEQSTQGRIHFEQTCPWVMAAEKFKKVVFANEGNIETLHLREGLVLLATAQQKPQYEAIRAAANILAAEVQDFHVDAVDTPCDRLSNAAREGKLFVQAEKTSRGMLLVFFSPDSAILDILLSDCCGGYCTCPSTHWRCSRCC